jgi:hypothetical protein
MGAAEVEAFLSWLANRRGASASTHRQARAALVFLYKQVLGGGSVVAGGNRPAAPELQLREQLTYAKTLSTADLALKRPGC